MKTYDVAVIGSGIVGMTAAYELSLRGQKVALIDTGLAHGASTANSSTLLMVGEKNDMVFDLRGKGLEKYKTMEARLGRDVGFYDLPMIGIMEKESEKALAQKEQEFYTSFGYDYRILDRETLHEMVPQLNMEGIVGGSCYAQWKIDPMQVIYAHFLKAKEHGMDHYFGSGATDFRVEGGRIAAVKTAEGEVQAGRYILAAGAWSRALMAKLHIDLPVYYLHGSAMICERGKLDLPCAVSLFTSERAMLEAEATALAGEYGWEDIPRCEAREFGILPDSNGNLLIAQKSHAESKIDRRLPVEYAHVMAEMMEKYFPGLCHGRVLRAWICPTPFPDDGNPYFGFVKAYPNLFCAAGLTSALLPGPAAGELMAKLLTGESCPYDLAPYDPMRGMKK